jgi:hypothetical protein|tara:strand:+ start:1338 stop:1526 length:189 start_codon:yes stop_codon:yes gene_type:complete
MKLTKDNALNKLKLATPTNVTAVMIDSDDVLQDKNKEVNDFRMLVDRVKVSNKNFTLILVCS